MHNCAKSAPAVRFFYEVFYWVHGEAGLWRCIALSFSVFEQANRSDDGVTFRPQDGGSDSALASLGRSRML